VCLLIEFSCCQASILPLSIQLFKAEVIFSSSNVAKPAALSLGILRPCNSQTHIALGAESGDGAQERLFTLSLL
jgi:hypothetical protein